jgi:hypothetical protein
MTIGFDTIVKAIVVILIGCLYYDYSRLRKQNEVLSHDIAGMNVAIKNVMDTTRNGIGQMRAEVKTISLSKDQAKSFLAEDIKKLKSDFGFRVTDLKTYIESSNDYRIPVVIEGKDTIIYNNTEKVFYMNGRYKGMLYTKGDTLTGNIAFTDTIRITVSKGKREKWWQLWKKRPLVTNAFMSHPDGTITSLKSVLAE